MDTSSQPIWSPYVLLSDLTGTVLEHSVPFCDVESAPLKLSAKIDSDTCTEPVARAIARLAILFLVTLPLFFVTSIRVFQPNQMVRNKLSNFTIPSDALKTTMALSLTFPAMVYYLGVLSIEQSVLVVSLISVFALNSMILQVILIVVAASLDFGNAVVVALFFVLSRSVFSLRAGLSTKYIAVIMGSIISVVFVLGHNVLPYLTFISFLEGPADAIFLSMSNSDLIAKYPVILRPIITFFNFVFSTPSSLKVPLAYIAVIILLLVCVSRIKKLHRKLKIDGDVAELNILHREIILNICGLSTIFLFVFIAPTYANAKYYIFLLPIFLLLPLRVFSVWKIVLFSQILSFLVIVQLMIFRL